MTDHRRGAQALGVAATMLLVACSGGGGTSPTSKPVPTPSPTTAPAAGATTLAPSATTIAGPSRWTVDTSACADPAGAVLPIEGTITIGSVMPLSGGPSAAFGPLKDGFQLYFDYANTQGLLPGYQLKVDIGDDQYDSTQTLKVLNGLIDDGASLFSGIIGSPNNLAVRDVLNGDCIPQLLALTGSPAWGEIADYPWTTGALVPYDIEASIYASKLDELVPDAKVALYYADNDFGTAYADAFKQRAESLGLQIVDEETIAPDVIDPPTAQVTSIAAALPDAILVAPLGLQCSTFLTELAAAKSQNPTWTPDVFVTNTCASKLFFGLAGTAADGVYTSNHLLDANDPKNASTPGMTAFSEAYLGAGLAGDPAVAEAGWNVGELTVAILKEALKNGPLTRKSIIEAARNMTYAPSLARPGVQYAMSGAADPYAFQTLQVIQWSSASQTFTEIGDPISDFES